MADGGRLAAAVRALSRRARRAVATSRARAGWDAMARRLAPAAKRSLPARGARRLARWTRASFGYRWLTAEPDPDVIVIDLRETWTVGPLLRGVAWLAPRIGRPWQASRLRDGGRKALVWAGRAPVRALGILTLATVLGLTLVALATGGIGSAALGWRLLIAAAALLATRVDASAAELRASRLGGAVVGLLEPPDPPE